MCFFFFRQKKAYEMRISNWSSDVCSSDLPSHGDIYSEKFLTSLKTATDELFFLPGVDRSRVSSIFTPDVRYIEVVEGGFAGGNVIPADYQPTQKYFDVVRANVGKGGHVGRYVAKDQDGAMIYSE